MAGPRPARLSTLTLARVLAIASPMFFILAVLTFSVQSWLMNFVFNSYMLTHPGKL